MENGKLPPGWVWKTIGEVTLPIEKADPKQNPKKEFTYLDIASIDNTLHKITEPKSYYGANAPSRARQLVKANDVLFSTVRTYLENIAQVPETYDGQIASTGFSVLRANGSVLPKYLFYYSLTQKFLEPLNELQRGTSYPAVRDNDVRVQMIPVAPLPEQERIVAKIEELFTQLDAGRVALAKVQAGLRRYKASVLKAAVEGKLIDSEVGIEEKSAAKLLQKLGKEPLSKDGLPSLPKSWCWARLAEISEALGGYSFSSKDYSEKGYQIIKIGNVKMGRLELNNKPAFISLIDEKMKRYRLQAGDIVITMTGTKGKRDYGYVAMVNNEKNLFLNQRLVRLRIIPPLEPKFFLIALQSEDYRNRFFASETGNVGQGNAMMSVVTEEHIMVPPLEEQHRIVAEVERRLSVARQVESAVVQALVRASRLRQAVLKSAFEGKLP